MMLSLRRVFVNSGWVIAEKGTSVFGLLWVTTEVAKYVGPTIFGGMGLCASFLSVVASLAWFGLQDVIFRKTSLDERAGVRLLAVTLYFRICFFTVLSFFAGMWIVSLYGGVIVPFLLAYIFSFALGLCDIPGTVNTSRMWGKINTITNTLGLVSALLLRVAATEYQLSLNWFVLPILTAAIFPIAVRFFYAFVHKENYLRVISYSLSTKGFSIFVFKKFCASGQNLFLYSAATLAYSQLPGWVLAFYDKDQYAIFTLAQSFGVAWVFIPAAVSTSFLPNYFRALREEEEKIAALWLRTVLLSAAACVVMVVFFLWWFESALFNSDYKGAHEVAVLLSVATLLSCIGQVSNRIILAAGGRVYLLKKACLMIHVSIFASIFFTSRYGAFGACYAILFVEFLSLTAFNYFFRGVDVLRRQMSSVGLNVRGRW